MVDRSFQAAEKCAVHDGFIGLNQADFVSLEQHQPSAVG